MYKIALINMPFANLQMPSIALTQLKSVLDAEFGDQIAVDVLYLNHDFARYLSIPFYNYIMGSMESHNAGLGDWFFRAVAFPDLPDNMEGYFRRYFPYRTERVETARRNITRYRKELGAFLDRLITEHKIDQANLVGFTSMFMQNVATFALAQKLKDRNPTVQTIMGGANCETPMGQEIVKYVKQIDYVFSGPALKSLPEFVRYCVADEPAKCHSIRGVFSRKNHAFQSGPGAIGEELDIDVPIKLDYESFLQNVTRYFPSGEVKPALLFETSRGCWWGERAHCTFCGLNGMNMAYRSMSPPEALSQFESLFKYAPAVSRYEAVDNILPRNYIADVLPFLNTPPQAHLFYEVKADLSEDDIRVLAKARVFSIQPGIESLATSTLKLMRKGTTAFQNLALLKNCAMYGVHPAWNLLIGFPGEGEDVYQKYVRDLPLLSHLPPPTDAFPVRFDRYSPYFVQAKQYELELQPLDFYKMIYPFAEDSISNLAYYFSDVKFDAKYMVVMLQWIGKIKERVKSWIMRWNSPEPTLPARLHFLDNGRGTAIYDSRSGQVVEHDVGNVGRQVLAILVKPRRIADVAKELCKSPGIDAENEIMALQARGLLFQEDDRYFSLVLPSTTVNGNHV